MKPLVIRSPAKINLFLKVVGKRTDGYHEIVTLMCRVGLFDTVTLSFGEPSIRVHCAHPQVPDGRPNLAYKAAAHFFEALSRQDGVAISIDKVIPVAAGLGGGSSNAAAVFMGLNEHYGLPFTEEKLMDMALRVGADVPFFVFGHCAVARGIGEQLERFCGLPSWSVVLVCPRRQISAAWAYKHFTLRLTNCEENFKVLPFTEDLSKTESLLCNDLEQVAVDKFPEIDAIKTALVDLGAKQALMSGSGPAVFGLFQDPQQASLALQRIKQERRWDTYLVNLLLP
ncbi:MAG: 4-(cytidine 5'-diphospho)-2-C-methyl-D-erythritol kinase [Thermodesulfobacteriota bacterium]|nr:4-(cytidine 5'-diphospho)-2-C-methyl-D-erythritol kinase [Thermodesulfobacteriota bacterium]